MQPTQFSGPDKDSVISQTRRKLIVISVNEENLHHIKQRESAYFPEKTSITFFVIAP